MTEIGVSAWAGCFNLGRIDLPGGIGKVGAWAFSASGVEAVTASGCGLVGAGAFAGCPRLRKVLFGRTGLGIVVFAGSHLLRTLAVDRVISSELLTLCGSSVCLIDGKCDGAVWTRLVEVVNPPGRLSLAVEWGEGNRNALVPMTSLTVRSGLCPIRREQRCYLAEIDLSVLASLPVGLKLDQCFFVKRVRLPFQLETIPAKMFRDCQRLKEVNLGACPRLRDIGNRAFLHCWKLRGIDVPEHCSAVRIDYSGIRILDLRFGHPTVVEAKMCAHLKRMILPFSFRGELVVGRAISMASLTIGDISKTAIMEMDMRPGEMRCVGARFPGASQGSAWLSMGRVFGELAGVGGRSGVPLLPG